jgi:hypothetical protein
MLQSFLIYQHVHLLHIVSWYTVSCLVIKLLTKNCCSFEVFKIRLRQSFELKLQLAVTFLLGSEFILKGGVFVLVGCFFLAFVLVKILVSSSYLILIT